MPFAGRVVVNVGPGKVPFSVLWRHPEMYSVVLLMAMTTGGDVANAH
jgi:hypothetical protein